MSDVIAVLGLGPMGRSLTSALLRAGRPAVVWNRTPGRAGDLLDRGARWAAGPAEALEAASVALICVRNYAAVASFLPVRTSTVLVNLTSGRPAEARDLAARDLPYLDGAILSPAPAIGTPAATILCSGPPDLFEQAGPVLRDLAPTTVLVGADPGAAAAYETALLDLFAMSVGGLVHAFAMADAEGIAPRSFAPLAKPMAGLLTEQIDRFAEQLTEGRFPAAISSVASMSSTLEHLVDAADGHDLDSGALRALRAIAARAVAAGHGDSGYAALSTVIRDRGGERGDRRPPARS
ncbi:NAD(P)-dependent oxidoreductase [Actinoplanes sp. NPDC020271]|uniref:NAD(P)-dependent oxidoreductase n=1 Tax=Actinoplanes sp. NPDC020271 TaxID=3363896 RepID=UPI0037B9EF54